MKKISTLGIVAICSATVASAQTDYTVDTSNNLLTSTSQFSSNALSTAEGTSFSGLVDNDDASYGVDDFTRIDPVNGAYLDMTLPGAQTKVQLQLRPRHTQWGYSGSWAPKQFDLQVSSDGQEWTTTNTCTPTYDSMTSDGKFYTFDIVPENTTFTMVRMLFTNGEGQGGGGNQIGELRMYPLVDNVSTAINGVAADKVSTTIIYDLQGRKVTKMTKGVYIVNGKKVVKK